MAFTPTTKLLACLGAAWLATGCVISDGDDDTEATTNVTNPTGGSDGGTAATDSGNDTNNMTTGQDSGETGNGTTMGGMDTTAGDTASVDSSGSGSGGGGGAIESCTVACEATAVCFKEDPSPCMADCEDEVVTVAGCEAEWAAQADCVAALDCQGISDWLDEVPKGAYPCMEADDALFACQRGA